MPTTTTPTEIDRRLLSQTAALYRYGVDASCCGWPPGYWPEAVQVAGLGNGEPLVRERAFEHCGEFAGYVYRQAAGCVFLTVYND